MSPGSVPSPSEKRAAVEQGGCRVSSPFEDVRKSAQSLVVNLRHFGDHAPSSVGNRKVVFRDSIGTRSGTDIMHESTVFGLEQWQRTHGSCAAVSCLPLKVPVSDLDVHFILQF